MTRPIDADALYDAMRDNEWQTFCPLDEVDDVIAAAPTLDYEPVRHCTILESNEKGKCKRIFSCCGTDCTQLTMGMIPNFCPFCGARMYAKEDKR